MGGFGWDWKWGVGICIYSPTSKQPQKTKPDFLKNQKNLKTVIIVIFKR
ncbi:hypothetical protein [uncultured Gammaproteobacteria bacterium]|nr:hypothetical protein [uncultured Gammaproteobacteria bacterium]